MAGSSRRRCPRLTDFKVDDVAAFRLKLFCHLQNDHHNEGIDLPPA
jgi:hypothetical protein